MTSSKRKVVSESRSCYLMKNYDQKNFFFTTQVNRVNFDFMTTLKPEFTKIRQDFFRENSLQWIKWANLLDVNFRQWHRRHSNTESMFYQKWMWLTLTSLIRSPSWSGDRAYCIYCSQFLSVRSKGPHFNNFPRKISASTSPDIASHVEQS